MVDATVTLYKDVGLSPDYSRTIDFTSKTAQTNWFNTVQTDKITLTNVNYNKVQNSLYVHEQFGDILSYSYARLQNIDESGRTYYAFISEAELVDDETTRFDLDIDPIQTFMTEFEIAPSFVVREHVDRWTSNNPLITPSREKISAFMNVESNEVIGDFTTDNENLRVVVIAYSSNTTLTINGDGAPEQVDRISYAYSIVNILDRDADIYGVRAYREYNEDGSSSTSATTVKYPTLNEIISGQFMDAFSITPQSIVSISILPIFATKFTSINVGDNINVNFPSFLANQHPESWLENNIITVPSASATLTVQGSNNALIWGNTIPTAQIYYAQIIGGKATGGEANLYPTYGSDTGTDGTVGLPILSADMVVSSLATGYYTMFTETEFPEQPVDGDVYSDKHEPMLWLEPFRQFNVVDYKGKTVLKIPNNVILGKGTSECRLDVTPIIDVSGITLQLKYTGDETDTNQLAGPVGNIVYYICDTLPFVNDAWLNYKLTSLDTDRANAMNQIVGNIITGGIYGTYGGALVGSRSASGTKDKPEKRNELLKRGAIGAAFIGGMSTVSAGIVDGMVAWETQKNKEASVKNQPSNIVDNNGATSFINSGAFNLQSVVLKCDDFNYGMSENTFKYYGYEVTTIKKPNIRSRKYYNYIITQGCCIKGSLNGDIKQQIAEIFDSGITVFHGDYCSEPDYPTNSTGEELENIERSLIS